MKKIPVDQIENGMVLAVDALSDDGSPLLGEGTALSVRHRTLLGRRGVEMVSIVSSEEDTAVTPAFLVENDEEPSSDGERVRKEIELIFAASLGNESMLALMRLALARIDRIHLSA